MAKRTHYICVLANAHRIHPSVIHRICRSFIPDPPFFNACQFYFLTASKTLKLTETNFPETGNWEETVGYICEDHYYTLKYAKLLKPDRLRYVIEDLIVGDIALFYLSMSGYFFDSVGLMESRYTAPNGEQRARGIL